MPIAHMYDEHIRNAINMIDRRYNLALSRWQTSFDEHSGPVPIKPDVYSELQEELDLREGVGEESAAKLWYLAHV
jgi:hypothetical protein